MTNFAHRVLATDGAARTGVMHTAHGDVATPAFMPVGTAGAMKGLHWREVREAGADIVLGNTYHLMLRPGAERVAALGRALQGGLRRARGPGPVRHPAGLDLRGAAPPLGGSAHRDGL